MYIINLFKKKILSINFNSFIFIFLIFFYCCFVYIDKYFLLKRNKLNFLGNFTINHYQKMKK
jgi:hypothetical protein